jgi:hypothetical protein|tara:strand:+ start:1697 stop:3604 length:1908 start_codon:yes stop_codon:yes gene_type:complete
MPQVEVVELKADVKDAIKSIDKMTDAIENLEKAQEEQAKAHLAELEKIQKANKAQTSATKKLAKGFKGVGLAMKAAGFAIVMKIVDRLSEALMENQQVADMVNQVFTAIGLVFKQVTDALFETFQRVSEATGGFDAMQKVITNMLKIAFTPLKVAFLTIKGAIQGAQLAWEQSWFGDGDPKKIEELKKGLAETGQAIKQAGIDAVEAGKNVVTNLGEAVGEVAMLATESIDAVSTVVENIDAQQVMSDAKRLQQLKKNYDLIGLQQQRLIEQYDEEAEKQRQIRDDVSLSISERIEANRELGKILEKQIEAEQKQAQARISNIKAQIALEGESDELKNSLYEAETELLAISAKVTGLKSEQLTNENALIQEQIALDQTLLESKNTLNIEQQRFNAERISDEVLKLETLKEIYNEEAQLELQRLEDLKNNAQEGTQARIDAEVAYNAKLQELEQQNVVFEEQITDTKKKLSDDEANTKRENLQKVGGALASLSTVLGEETAAGKATAIAATTISTYQSAQDSYKSLAGIPIIGPALGFAASAAAIIGGIAQIRKITATKIPKTPDQGGSPTPTQTSAPQMAQGGAPNFSLIGASETNQLAQALGEQENEPVQAYVVANDVTTAQSLERNIVETTSL